MLGSSMCDFLHSPPRMSGAILAPLRRNPHALCSRRDTVILFTLWLSLNAVSFMIILVLAVRALIVTHRAAGAIYHIRRLVEAVKSGNTGERIHLRETDEFRDLAQSGNEMLDVLQRK